MTTDIDELLKEFEILEGVPAEKFDEKDWNRFDRFCDSREKENKEDINTTEESKLLSLFEKYKGYSSNLFDNEEWRECDAFIAGYKLAQK